MLLDPASAARAALAIPDAEGRLSRTAHHHAIQGLNAIDVSETGLRLILKARQAYRAKVP